MVKYGGTPVAYIVSLLWWLKTDSSTFQDLDFDVSL